MTERRLEIRKSLSADIDMGPVLQNWLTLIWPGCIDFSFLSTNEVFFNVSMFTCENRF